MSGIALAAGLSPHFPSPPPLHAGVEMDITEEAAVTAPAGTRFIPLVEEGDSVAQGAPVAQMRGDGGMCLVAPMPGRVGHVRLLPGRRLSEIVLFREAGGDRLVHATGGDVRAALQAAGFWPLLRRRPFGGMPATGETPAAIVVMAFDTRPLAPDPRAALEGREEHFVRGLDALAGLTGGPVFVCHRRDERPPVGGSHGGGIRTVACGTRHPQGLAGIRIHALFPASLDAPVWDIHAEDVAAIGEFLETGLVPETRLVHVTGPGLRESRVVRTQPGADLRGLTHRVVLPGAHELLSGSPLDGKPAHWLDARDRQVSVMPGKAAPARPHWLRSAIMRRALPAPVIPSAALTQAVGAAFPAMALVRALTAGDDETAVSLGVLSLLEEDLALADYILGEAQLRTLLRAMLDRLETEMVG